jgi:hypothetical protein
MSEQAKVADVEVIERFRAALLSAAEAFGLALQDAEAEVDRTVNWVEGDRIETWKRRIRKAQDEVVACKGALYRKQEIKATPEARPSVVDERKALERAQRKLEHAEAKLRQSKRWSIELPRQAIVFKGGLSPMQALLDRDVPHAAAMLRRMSEHLEEYLRGGDEGARILEQLSSMPSMRRGGDAPGPGRPSAETPGASDGGPPEGSTT